METETRTRPTYDLTGRPIHDDDCPGEYDRTRWEVVELRQNAGEIEYRCRDCGAVFWTTYPERTE